MCLIQVNNLHDYCKKYSCFCLPSESKFLETALVLRQNNHVFLKLELLRSCVALLFYCFVLNTCKLCQKPFLCPCATGCKSRSGFPRCSTAHLSKLAAV